MALCDQLTCQLQKLYDLIAGRNQSYSNGTTPDGWSFKQTGHFHIYEKIITLGTDPNDTDLNFPEGMILNDVEQIFQTAGAPSSNAKDFDVRVYTSPGDGYYSQLDTATADTSTNAITCGIKNKYGSNTKLRVHYVNYTAGDTVKIIVQADDLGVGFT